MHSRSCAIRSARAGYAGGTCRSSLCLLERRNLTPKLSPPIAGHSQVFPASLPDKGHRKGEPVLCKRPVSFGDSALRMSDQSGRHSRSFNLSAPCNRVGVLGIGFKIYVYCVHSGLLRQWFTEWSVRELKGLRMQETVSFHACSKIGASFHGHQSSETPAFIGCFRGCGRSVSRFPPLQSNRLETESFFCVEGIAPRHSDNRHQKSSESCTSSAAASRHAFQ